MFTLPPDASSVKATVLCLTHEGVVKDFLLSNIYVLNPLVDSITGATYPSLLDYPTCSHIFQVIRVNLTLPGPCADGVSPMAVEMQHYTLPNEGEPTSRHGTSFRYIDVSQEGEVRGFYRKIPRRRLFEAYENYRIMKFTIDTRQDEWVITKWSHLAGHT